MWYFWPSPGDVSLGTQVMSSGVPANITCVPFWYTEAPATRAIEPLAESTTYWDAGTVTAAISPAAGSTTLTRVASTPLASSTSGDVPWRVTPGLVWAKNSPNRLNAVAVYST